MSLSDKFIQKAIFHPFKDSYKFYLHDNVKDAVKELKGLGSLRELDDWLLERIDEIFGEELTHPEPQTKEGYGERLGIPKLNYKDTKREYDGCDCHMFVGGSGKSCPKCQKEGCTHCEPSGKDFSKAIDGSTLRGYKFGCGKDFMNEEKFGLNNGQGFSPRVRRICGLGGVDDPDLCPECIAQNNQPDSKTDDLHVKQCAQKGCGGLIRNQSDPDSGYNWVCGSYYTEMEKQMYCPECSQSHDKTKESDKA